MPDANFSRAQCRTMSSSCEHDFHAHSGCLRRACVHRCCAVCAKAGRRPACRSGRYALSSSRRTMNRFATNSAAPSANTTNDKRGARSELIGECLAERAKSHATSGANTTRPSNGFGNRPAESGPRKPRRHSTTPRRKAKPGGSFSLQMRASALISSSAEELSTFNSRRTPDGWWIAGSSGNHPDWFDNDSIPQNVSGEIFYDDAGRWIGTRPFLFRDLLQFRLLAATSSNRDPVGMVGSWESPFPHAGGARRSHQERLGRQGLRDDYSTANADAKSNRRMNSRTKKPACSAAGSSACRSFSVHLPTPATSRMRHLKFPSMSRLAMPPSACALISMGDFKARQYALATGPHACSILLRLAAHPSAWIRSDCSVELQTPKLPGCSSNLFSRWRGRSFGTSRSARPEDQSSMRSGANPSAKNSMLQSFSPIAPTRM